MPPYLLRQFWTLVEQLQSSGFGEIDDETLVDVLVEQLSDDPNLDRGETAAIERYVRIKLPLIRDMLMG